MHALDTMRALASKAEVIHLSQGDVLFRTGETGTCMYGLLEGSVRLSTATATNDCRLIAMNRDKFLFAVQETPMFAVQLLASIDARLRDIKLADG